MRTALLLPALALLAAPVAVAGGSAATADASNASDNATRVYRAQLDELNDSGAHGVAKLRLQGRTLNITIKASGLAPNLVHAQHIHGIGNSECPPPSAAGTDGILSTADGLPFYGPIVTSLTTSGDTSPAAGLTIELMPVADGNGDIRYKRTIELPADVAADLDAFQIVQHGVDFNNNSAYDFSVGASELNAAFPQEATAPANCGTIAHQHDASHQH